MHGGFENETPNIPTNSILKLDLIAHVKGNSALLAKIESAYKSQIKGEPSKNPAATGGPDSSLGPGISKPATPPM